MNIEQLKKDMKENLLYGKVDLKQLSDEMGSENFVQFLLDNTGNPHSIFRENILGFVEVDYISPEDCVKMLDVYLSGSHLFNGLGGQGDDSVFWRSFSSLGVGYLVEEGSKRGFLSQEQYMTALNKAIEYMQKEVDYRGFVSGGKGWAHAVSHSADMLCALVNSDKFPMAFADKILDCIKVHITVKHRFIDGDESRMSAVIVALVKKGLNEKAMQTWLNSLTPRITTKRYTDESYPDIQVLFNIKGLIAAIYFGLGEDTKNDELKKIIREYDSTLWQRAYASQ